MDTTPTIVAYGLSPSSIGTSEAASQSRNFVSASPPAIVTSVANHNSVSHAAAVSHDLVPRDDAEDHHAQDDDDRDDGGVDERGAADPEAQRGEDEGQHRDLGPRHRPISRNCSAAHRGASGACLISGG